MKKAKPKPNRNLEIIKKDYVRTLIDQAIQLAGGTQRNLADKIGMTQHAIHHARKVGRVSAELAGKIHDFTKGAVSREALRPDLFRSAA